MFSKAYGPSALPVPDQDAPETVSYVAGRRTRLYLENDIRARIDTWNDNPRPFAWTKTAGEILNSLADHLIKINPPDTT